MKAIIHLKDSLGVLTETYRYLKMAEDRNLDSQSLQREWADQILQRVKVNLKVQGQVSSSPSMLFIGNHISYLDIPVLMKTVPKVSFVAKHEISSWRL